MASNVVSDNFETGSGGVPQLGGADRQTQWCKAWVNFNGTGTVAIRGSFNVSSITDNGTGNYTVNFTTAFADVNYSMSGSVGSTDAVSGMWLGSGSNVGAFYNNDTVSSSKVQALFASGNTADTTHIKAMFFSN